jgi:hypothetical protein
MALDSLVVYGRYSSSPHDFIAKESPVGGRARRGPPAAGEVRGGDARERQELRDELGPRDLGSAFEIGIALSGDRGDIRTSIERSRARLIAALQSIDLPTPASPSMRRPTSPPVPAFAALRKRSTAWSSRARPTMSGPGGAIRSPAVT